MSRINRGPVHTADARKFDELWLAPGGRIKAVRGPACFATRTRRSLVPFVQVVSGRIALRSSCRD
jgi:hypothetical protein